MATLKMIAALLIMAFVVVPGWRFTSAAADLDSSTKLLIHADGANSSTTFNDSGPSGFTLTPTSATVSTTQAKFGGASAYFGASTASRLSVPDNAAFQPSGAYTIDFWVYMTDVTTFQGLFSKSNTSSYSPYLILVTGGSIQALVSSNGTSWDVTSGTSFGSISANTWNHVAVVWTGSTYYFFLNGAVGATLSSSATPYASSGNAVVVGNYQSGAGSYTSNTKGYIDEVRYSSTARWTSAFTPPHLPYGQVVINANVQVASNLDVRGSVSKGSGTFVIDHPLHPRSMLLYHSFVESPEAKNVYDGVVRLDENGEATIRLPDYFQALNESFRYQFLPMGDPMPGLYIKQEIRDNAFTIGGGEPGGEVSWQVTGIRRDPYIQANPIRVEVEKGPGQPVEKGEYLFPEYEQYENPGGTRRVGGDAVS